MEKLDIRKRAVLNLYYTEQLSVPEISAALNIPKGTVKSRLHRARKELIPILNETSVFIHQ